MKPPYVTTPEPRLLLKQLGEEKRNQLSGQKLCHESRVCTTASGIIHSADTSRHLIEEVNRSMMEKETGERGWGGATGGLDG